MTDWMLITSRPSWELLRDAGAWKFADKSLRRAKGVQPGEKALVYLTRESVFAAIVEFTDPVQTAVPERIFDGLFPHKVPFRVLQSPNYAVPILRHIHDLAFIKNKASWSSHLQGQAIRAVDPADFQLVSSALGTRAPSLGPTPVSSK